MPLPCSRTKCAKNRKEYSSNLRMIMTIIRTYYSIVKSTEARFAPGRDLSTHPSRPRALISGMPVESEFPALQNRIAESGRCKYQI